MPFGQANGQRLYYEVHGEGEPLICVMGLSADHLGWMLQVPALAQQFRTVVFDNRDAGQSSPCEAGYKVPEMAVDTLALADSLEIDDFHLIGMSMGGAIAQEVALAAPERVRTLTLCATWAGGGRYAAEKTRLWGSLAARMSREEQIDEMLLLCLSEDFFEQPEAVQFARQMLLANPHPQSPEAFARQLDASGGHEARDRLGGLAMPVHVIGAEHDILVPAWKSAEIAALVPGAKLTMVERGAHGLNIERAEEFNRAVLDFLAEHATEAAGQRTAG